MNQHDGFPDAEKIKDILDVVTEKVPGLIKELSISDDGSVNIVLRPSSPVCPLAFVLAANIKETLKEMEGTRCVNLKIVDFVRADELNKMMSEA